MTSRRAFLTRSGLALGALIVGDEVLETLAHLTHVRKSFPSAGIHVYSETFEWAPGITVTDWRISHTHWTPSLDLYPSRETFHVALSRNLTVRTPSTQV